MHKYEDGEFKQKFRFSKESVLYLENCFLNDIPIGRGPWIPKRIKLLIVLRVYATNSFQSVCADLIDVSQPLISNVVRSISECIASKRSDFIKMPRTADDILNTQTEFRRIAGFPRVIGVIDCTHIRIGSVGGPNAERFRCRKNYFSINTQVVGGPNYEITNIVARWPGSTHDSRIFDNSFICAKFENNEMSGLLLGDQGYPCRTFLMTPLHYPHSQAEFRYNTSLSKTRAIVERIFCCLLYTSPSPRDLSTSRMPSSA